jgi:hypothetical protein
VFLRHVAPTRSGDQPLAAGEHLAPGFSQRRDGGALHLLREPLCMHVQSEYTWSLSIIFVTVSLCQYFLVFSVFDF